MQDLQDINKIRSVNNYQKDAMTDLLKLHPIGSSVQELMQTLEQAGAKKVSSGKFKDFLFYHYDHGSVWFGKKWIVTINIKDFSIYKIVVTSRGKFI